MCKHKHADKAIIPVATIVKYIIMSTPTRIYIQNFTQNPTLEDIYFLCFPYELCKAYELLFKVKEYRDSIDLDGPGGCKTDWLNQMLQEKDSANTKAIDLIVQHAECTENATSSCRYSCQSDCSPNPELCM